MMDKLISILAIAVLSISAVAADDREDATFKSLDRDTDQRLSKTEAAGDKMLTEHFSAIDADSDGYLTKREYTAHMKDMKKQPAQRDY